MGEVLAALSAALVAAGFVRLAIADAKTSRVVVSHAKQLTVLAFVGLLLSGLLDRNGRGLATATIGALLVTGIQLVPYLGQARWRRQWIGRADVRLSVPFGWTLGYFGLGYAFIGFGVALIAGLVVALPARRKRLPFVPFMAFGLLVGLVWAALVAL